MGINAKAHLWYGVVEKRSKLLELATSRVKGKRDEWDKLEKFAKELGFTEYCLQREGWEETEDHAVGVWGVTCYDFDDTKKFKMPTQGELDQKWKKLAQELQIKKKPGWYLWTEYS